MYELYHSSSCLFLLFFVLIFELFVSSDECYIFIMLKNNLKVTFGRNL